MEVFNFSVVCVISVFCYDLCFILPYLRNTCLSQDCEDILLFVIEGICNIVVFHIFIYCVCLELVFVYVVR